MGLKEELDYIWENTPIHDPLRLAKWSEAQKQRWLRMFNWGGKK